jgi:dTDP-4-amino-4,6-dideoxy-D-galactose acyltransferase
MDMIDFNHLDWDSDFFGFKIGKCTIIHFDESIFQSFLREKKQENYQLIVVFSDQDLINYDFLKKNNGQLIDQKVTFRFEETVRSQSESKHPAISSYKSEKLDKNLLDLALQSGHFSRFFLDKNFKKGSFEKMYRLWMENSINKKIADDVIVFQENKKIMGMVTVKYAENVATIGLIAVDLSERGKNIGTHLLNELKHQIQAKNIRFIDVATQKDNEQACHFYEKNGFLISKTAFIYHFWA